ncbi:NAC domain [Dillenia turbinata]|uniref:NAC domain n=1 Tax=Dillenia turbinata TaxID=194707 RepID=A0AAN8Z339_9MAGN
MSGEDLNFPLGIRFCPTNEELISYLWMKINGEPLPPNKIIEANVYEFSPQILIGDGYWKASGSVRSIMERGREIGLKQSLVFYVGKSPSGIKTNWIMHEFRVSQSPSRPSTTSNPMMLDEHVLYKIYRKNRRTVNEEDKGGVEDHFHNEQVEVMNGDEPQALEGIDVIGNGNSIAVNPANQSSNGQFWSHNGHQPSTCYNIASNDNMVIYHANQTTDGQNFYDQFNTSYNVGDAANEESMINSTNQTTNGQFESYTHDHVSTFYNFGDFFTQGVQEYDDNMLIDSANQMVDGLLQGYYGDHQSHFHDQPTQTINELFQNKYIDHQLHIHDQTTHITETQEGGA